jgi:hypothetical protein
MARSPNFHHSPECEPIGVLKRARTPGLTPFGLVGSTATTEPSGRLAIILADRDAIMEARLHQVKRSGPSPVSGTTGGSGRPAGGTMFNRLVGDLEPGPRTELGEDVRHMGLDRVS